MESVRGYEAFWKFLIGDDLDFYEEFLIELSDEEIHKFYKENPDFMKEYGMYEGRLDILRDKMYRGILRGIYKK